MVSFSDRRNVSKIVIRFHCCDRYCSFGPFSYRIKHVHFIRNVYLLTVGQEPRFSEIHAMLLISQFYKLLGHFLKWDWNPYISILRHNWCLHNWHLHRKIKWKIGRILKRIKICHCLDQTVEGENTCHWIDCEPRFESE